MTQLATPQSVVPAFDNVRLETGGQWAKLARRGDEFWVDTVDPQWQAEQFRQWEQKQNRSFGHHEATANAEEPRVTARVVMTTGSHHFQVYWIAGQRDGQLWQFPWRYHIGEKRWIHRKDVFLAPPEWRPGMWSRVWNYECILCHSTGPHPGLNVETNLMEDTKVAELGIACEACHGPGHEHARRNRNPLERYRQHASDSPDPTIVNPARLSHQRSSEICAFCHSHLVLEDDDIFVRGPVYRPGDDLGSCGRLATPPSSSEVLSRFWADGDNRSGGREHSGMVQSACFTKGELSCLDCHSMHDSDPNDQLAEGMEGNSACYQCHETFRERLVEHTHHSAESNGSLCYNCHMPHTNYALFAAIRSHRIDIPRVTNVVSNARPNACNLCHLDKTLAWSAEHLERWYSMDTPLLDNEERTVAGSLLWSLRGDAGQRAIAAWHFGWQPALGASGDRWMVPALAALLEDPYAAVRWLAYISLRRQQGFADFAYDFDAPRQQRAEARDRAMAIYDNQPAQRDHAATDSRLLFDQRGKPDAEAMDWILLRRDDRLINSVE
jgi:predicted CXXCH cytochrome family protein